MPRNLLNTGHAWEFDIIFTPAVEELHTLLFNLDMQYAARDYRFTTDSVVLSSIVPPAPVVPPAPAPEPPPAPPAAPPPAPVAPVAPPVPPAPEPQPDDYSRIITIAAITVAGVVAALLVAAAAYTIYGITRPAPYGYLCDDRGELLLDFSAVERTTMTLIRSKNLISGAELGIPELKGLSFYFGKDEVDIRSAQTEPSIRINNRPLIDGERDAHWQTSLDWHARQALQPTHDYAGNRLRTHHRARRRRRLTKQHTPAATKRALATHIASALFSYLSSGIGDLQAALSLLILN